MAHWYDVPDTITALKWGAGLYVPNRDFEDYNSGIAGDSYTGEDGEVGLQTGFAGWYYTRHDTSQKAQPRTTGSTGYESQDAYFGAGALELESNSNQTDVDWDDHDTYSVCAYTGMLPLNRIFKAGYGRKWALAFTARGALGYPGLSTFCRIVLSQYSSSYAYLGSNDFDLSGASASANYWIQNLVTLSSGLNASTEYVMIQIAMNNGGSGTLSVGFDQISLFTSGVQGSSSAYYNELSDVFYRGVPKTAWQSRGVSDLVMLDGHMDRRNANPAGLKHRIALEWYREEGDNLESLAKMAQVSKRGWGGTITEPCPICIDAGFGAGPHWGYYHVIGSSFDATFHPAHKDAGYNVGLLLEEV